MKKQPVKQIRNRDNEKGAALVMALLVSFLLLVASAGLLLESALNTQNVTDVTAEEQAYNAAESGIQSAVNVLRGNVVPNPLLDTSKPATDPANKINFVKALMISKSNLSGDTSTVPRLSRWLGYDGTCNDRVVLGGGACNVQNGYGYSLTISDPDNTGSIVSFSTTGRFFDLEAGNTDPTQRVYGTGANKTIIKYTPTTVTNLNVTSGAASTNFGKFTVTITGTGAAIPADNRFEIVIRTTKPYTTNRVMRGFIETQTTSLTTPPKVKFDAQTYSLMGSTMNLLFTWGSPINVAAPGYGYEARLNTGDSVVTGSMTSPEPTRLLLRATGYGPRGSTKTLEAIIQKDFFNGLSAPATLTLVGPPSTTACLSPTCIPAQPVSAFTFNPGSSNVTVYSGDDTASSDIIPPIGTINNTNLDDVQDSVTGLPPHPFNGTIIGAPSNVSEEMPDWLTDPVHLDNAINSLYTVANSSGRYYASGVTPPDFGNNTTAQGITFCDGDCTFTGNGGGILVVTGTLTFQGNFNFNGLIVVTGPGGVLRSGGGNGTIQGNIVVAPYAGSQISDNLSPTSTSTFLAPQYDLSGGGNSTVVYNSTSVAGGLVAVSNFVLGVVEK